VRQFLEHDRLVLRFYCLLWEDKSLNTAIQPTRRVIMQV
jgi:hypothetical protein